MKPLLEWTSDETMGFLQTWLSKIPVESRDLYSTAADAYKNDRMSDTQLHCMKEIVAKLFASSSWLRHGGMNCKPVEIMPWEKYSFEWLANLIKFRIANGNVSPAFLVKDRDTDDQFLGDLKVWWSAHFKIIIIMLDDTNLFALTENGRFAYKSRDDAFWGRNWEKCFKKIESADCIDLIEVDASTIRGFWHSFFG